MTLESFVRIVWTVFEKFDIFIERSGEKTKKTRRDCISSRKFFPTPKNVSGMRACMCGPGGGDVEGRRVAEVGHGGVATVHLCLGGHPLQIQISRPTQPYPSGPPSKQLVAVLRVQVVVLLQTTPTAFIHQIHC